MPYYHIFFISHDGTTSADRSGMYDAETKSEAAEMAREDLISDCFGESWTVDSVACVNGEILQ